MTSFIQDDEERAEMSKTIREVEEDFNCWFIKRERDRIADFCQGISEHLRAANTIYPDPKNPAFEAEVTERRIEMDRALVCCNKLQDELKYLAEVLPADKNKFMNIVLEIQDEFNIIKKLRQSDNRFRKSQ